MTEKQPEMIREKAEEKQQSKNQNPNRGHNSKKAALGPNTKR
ncbi:MAG: hypothetical protein ACI4PC_07780 [Oscillospiraceae bacterium]